MLGIVKFINNLRKFLTFRIIRCIITVLLQMKIMRDFEVMIGWLRLSIIYFISGIGGYLASAVFVPYMVFFK